jgi:hypothetical protein
MAIGHFLLLLLDKVVSVGGFEPPLFFVPNEVPCRARRHGVKIGTYFQIVIHHIPRLESVPITERIAVCITN